MRRADWLRASLVALAFGKSFAMNLDSLPVWNPDYLVQNKSVAEAAARTESQSSKLETHGYKTMQVTVGDGGTQVDQELRLSIQGFVGDSVYIDALLSDVDRRAGDQTTATLQEVDQVYFRAESKHWMVHLGDLTWKDENMGLFSLERSTLGAMAGLRAGYTEVRGAAGTDRTDRRTVVMNGVSGQREGYAMSGDGAYLSVVPGSESVWVNGVKLSRGTDYEVNYAGGLLDFRGARVPGPDDEIRIEYDSYEDEDIYNLYAAKAKYRHPNLYLDLSGFRLENDRDRMKRGVWTDDDYAALKSDKGGELFRSNDSLPGGVDSLSPLTRPERVERFGARMRMQAEHRYFADLEIAMNRQDTNTVSHDIDGPEGRAYRWYLTTDSSEQMKKFPVAFSVYGNYIEEGFRADMFQGSDQDWNSYRLLDEWDLDSAAITSGDLRHDEFGMRTRLATGWYTDALWGYRQGENEDWNSSRAKLSLVHKTRDVSSDVGVVRVASVQDVEKERYQALGNAEYLQGLWRPFGNFDVRYTRITDDAEENPDEAVEDEVAYGKSGTGFRLVGDRWSASEGVEEKLAKRRGDSFGKEWADSLRSLTWTQTAEYRGRHFGVEHFLQYERRALDSSDVEHSWMGDVDAHYTDDDRGISGNVSYKLGLTEEQTYTAVYKAVAPGTGDVRYDSLTGAFIEDVDNGDFVYEGMGRNDSIGAVRASNAAFSLDVEWNPGLSLGVRRGILRDITLGGMYSAAGEDTTGKKLFFPPATPHELRKISSGTISWEARLGWMHPMGISVTYKPGADYDKKLSSMEYFETIFHHDVDAGYQINENHFVGATFLLEEEELQALQDLEWNTRDYSGRYRYNFLDGFHVQPGGRYRVGEGSDDAGYEFDAYLWEASLRLGYAKDRIGDAFVQFSAIQMESGDDVVPYQMMSGYSEGRTYRFEASASVEINDFLSFGLHYVLRFGNAEENIFQKLSTEARAVF